MATITALLEQKGRSAAASNPAFILPRTGGCNDRILNDESFQTTTHDECHYIVDLHSEWLREKIHQAVNATIKSSTTSYDVIIAYLSDNSPDLLMNLLACIDLTDQHFPNTADGVMPAMMNVRWTSLEISRVLSPKRSNNGVGSGNNRCSFVTVLLYGDDYEKAAAEAIDFINNAPKSNDHHYAVALPLPTFTSTADTCLKKINIRPKYSLLDSSLQTEASGKDAILLFTSGTSSALGIPKGVRLSHRSLFVQAFAKTQSPCGYDEKTIVAANTVPLFHIGGLSSLLAVLLGGGSLLFPQNVGTEKSRGFRPEVVLGSLRGQSTANGFTGVNTLVVVPAMLHSIFEHIDQNKGYNTSLEFPNVRLILVGGQSIGNGSLHSQTRQRFPHARIVQTYACTEAGSSITFEDLGYKHSSHMESRSDEVAKTGATCVGFPPPHIQIGIFSPDKQLLPNGEMGIIGTCGAHTMSGYWNRGDPRTQASFQTIDNEWMLTSDLGYTMNGKLYFCGRANDVIRTGGESVLATEVETVLGLYHDITEVAVFALPDEKFGETICAAVVSKSSLSGFDLFESNELKDSLRRHCAKHHLAGFKHPRRVFCMQSLPRNSSGKVVKQQIMKVCSQLSSINSRL